MLNKIEILSPGPSCKKTQRIVDSIKNLLEKKKVQFEMQIIYNQDELIKYQTWILPTVIVNNHIVSRGYKPDEKKLLQLIKW